MTQFLLLLKACSHSVCVNCMHDVFSNKQIKIIYHAIFLGMISKTKTTRHTLNYNKDVLIQWWAEKRKKRKKTKKKKNRRELSLFKFNWSDGEKQKQVSCASYWLQVSCAKLIYREKSNKTVISPNTQTMDCLFCNLQYY